MEANYVHKDSTTLIHGELVKNELNQIELQYNAIKQQKFNELLKENQELKEKLDVLENQQKEFIEYMNKTIEELECDDVDDEEMKGYLIQRIDTFKENILKFKEIIGVKVEYNYYKISLEE